MKLNALALIISTTLSLSACSSLVHYANDPTRSKPEELGFRSASTILDDEAIESNLQNSLNLVMEEQNEHGQVNITVFNGVLLLTGSATDADKKAQIEQIVSKQPGIKTIHNELKTKLQSNSEIAKDRWITTKIKASMFFTEGFPSSKVKVITHKGTVYLLGMLTEEEKQWAIELSKSAEGVNRIVSVIEPLTETSKTL